MNKHVGKLAFDNLQARHRKITMQDGALLGIYDYMPEFNLLPPIVCLGSMLGCRPDFENYIKLFYRYSNCLRRFILVDFRGQGASDYHHDMKAYSLQQDAADVLDILTALNIKTANFIGCERGALALHHIAVMRPHVINASALIDIGPQVNPAGLLRMKHFAKLALKAKSLDHIALIYKQTLGHYFPDYKMTDWRTKANNGFENTKDFSSKCYKFDPAILNSLAETQVDKPIANLWSEFTALCKAPMLVLRAQNSDMLSRDTYEMMTKASQSIQSFEIPLLGHSPSLTSAPVFRKLTNYLEAY